MNKHTWRITYGFIKIALAYIPIQIALLVVYQLDKFWSENLWKVLFGKEFILLGLILSLGLFYLSGWLSEWKLVMWMEEKVRRTPYVGKLLFPLDPHMVQNLKRLLNEEGALYVQYQDGFQVAALVAVRETREGVLGTALFLKLPLPDEQLINEKRKIYVLEETEINPEGVPRKRYRRIPAKIALQQLLAGVGVPRDAYLNAVEITFGEYVEAERLLHHNNKADV